MQLIDKRFEFWKKLRDLNKRTPEIEDLNPAITVS